MQTAYQKIVAYAGPPENFRNYLRRYLLDEPFAELWGAYDSAKVITAVIRYIVQAYSRESEFVLLGAVWAQVKENVARHVELPDECWDAVVHLGNFDTYEAPSKKEPKNLDEFEEEENRAEEQEEPKGEEELLANVVVRAINAWLAYENDRDNRHLRMLQDQYEEMMLAASQKLLKSGGGVDFATKATCRKQAKEILTEIEDMERAIREKDNKNIKEARREVKQVTSLRPEITAKK